MSEAKKKDPFETTWLTDDASLNCRCTPFSLLHLHTYITDIEEKLILLLGRKLSFSLRTFVVIFGRSHLPIWKYKCLLLPCLLLMKLCTLSPGDTHTSWRSHNCGIVRVIKLLRRTALIRHGVLKHSFW